MTELLPLSSGEFERRVGMADCGHCWPGGGVPCQGLADGDFHIARIRRALRCGLVTQEQVSIWWGENQARVIPGPACPAPPGKERSA